MVHTKTAFIVNPHAGSGSTGANWPQIEEFAKKAIGSFEAELTTGPSHAGRLAQEMVSKGMTRIVGVGGDGTLNEIINGCMAKQDLMASDFALGFIPNGTGCDIVKTLDIPRDNKKAVAVVAAGKSRPLDIGRVLYKDHDGNSATRYFHNIASFGLSGEVDKRVNSSKKTFGPTIAYLASTLNAIFRFSPRQMHLSLDDGRDLSVRAWHVTAANGRYQGGGMLIAPDADVSDGLFNVTIIGDLSIFDIFMNLINLYNGKIYTVKDVSHYRTKYIRATSTEHVLLDIDGEQPGTLPVEIDILPAALNIITA
jgi:diacylglycerol kinase (ATP)